MSDIAPLNNASAASYSFTGRPERAASATPEATRGSDQVDFSESARALSRLADTPASPEFRQELVDKVRAEIEAGTYETPEKLDQAIDKLAEDLA
ncbi:MAG: flagellar biosynthesis anti-sigma factor FlgM [Planctomycetota bacterium]